MYAFAKFCGLQIRALGVHLYLIYKMVLLKFYLSGCDHVGIVNIVVVFFFFTKN